MRKRPFFICTAPLTRKLSSAVVVVSITSPSIWRKHTELPLFMLKYEPLMAATALWACAIALVGAGGADSAMPARNAFRGWTSTMLMYCGPPYRWPMAAHFSVMPSRGDEVSHCADTMAAESAFVWACSQIAAWSRSSPANVSFLIMTGFRFCLFLCGRRASAVWSQRRYGHRRAGYLDAGIAACG